MLPLSASISRLASRSSVVLPEPEPPTMARNSPLGDLERDVVHGQDGFRAAAAVKALADMREGDQWRGGGHPVGTITLRSERYQATTAITCRRGYRLNCRGGRVKPHAELEEIGETRCGQG